MIEMTRKPSTLSVLKIKFTASILHLHFLILFSQNVLIVICASIFILCVTFCLLFLTLSTYLPFS